ncbi:MAG TPA: glycosyltransferase, partial [Longimicrobiales bacterium]|nr:glycosyltransferase [Longimicrobiales bacterium]
MSVRTVEDLRGMRIGYTPYAQDLAHPADRRRFVHYARSRGIEFVRADPGGSYDLVLVTAAGDVPGWSRFPRARGRLVFELIDSYLREPQQDLRQRVRGVAKFIARQSTRLALDYRASLLELCARADAVICSTPEQRADLLEYNTNVHAILDVHTGFTNTVKSDYGASSPFRLVWEGVGYNMFTLGVIAPVLAELRAQHAIELHVLSDLEYATVLRHHLKRSGLALLRRTVPGQRAFLYQWNEAMMPAIATACDVAVIPVPYDVPIAVAKPENRLLLFWRMGVPAVTTATPAYTRVMTAAGIDMACTTQQEWYDTLARMITDEAARRDAGERGRAWVEAEHAEARTLARWDAALLSAAG